MRDLQDNLRHRLRSRRRALLLAAILMGSPALADEPAATTMRILPPLPLNAASEDIKNNPFCEPASPAASNLAVKLASGGTAPAVKLKPIGEAIGLHPIGVVKTNLGAPAIVIETPKPAGVRTNELAMPKKPETEELVSGQSENQPPKVRLASKPDLKSRSSIVLVVPPPKLNPTSQNAESPVAAGKQDVHANGADSNADAKVNAKDASAEPTPAQTAPVITLPVTKGAEEAASAKQASKAQTPNANAAAAQPANAQAVIRAVIRPVQTPKPAAQSPTILAVIPPSAEPVVAQTSPREDDQPILFSMSDLGDDGSSAGDSTDAENEQSVTDVKAREESPVELNPYVKSPPTPSGLNIKPVVIEDHRALPHPAPSLVKVPPRLELAPTPRKIENKPAVSTPSVTELRNDQTNIADNSKDGQPKVTAKSEEKAGDFPAPKVVRRKAIPPLVVAKTPVAKTPVAAPTETTKSPATESMAQSVKPEASEIAESAVKSEPTTLEPVELMQPGAAKPSMASKPADVSTTKTETSKTLPTKSTETARPIAKSSHSTPPGLVKRSVSKLRAEPENDGDSPFRHPVAVQPIPLALERSSDKSNESVVRPPVASFDESHAKSFAQGGEALTPLYMSRTQVRSLTLGGQVQRVEVADKNVCQAFAAGPNQLKLIGTGNGVTQLVVWADVDNEAQTRKRTFEIHVQEGVATTGRTVGKRMDMLNTSISRMFPDCVVRIRQVSDHLLVEGLCDTEQSATKIIRMVRKTCLIPVRDELQVR